MRELRVAAVVSALAVAGMLIGCSDDDTAGTDAGIADKGASDGVTTTDGAAMGTLAVKVAALEVYPWWFTRAAKGKPTALTGAKVAVDLPGGKRVEATSANDGTATFKDVDWSKGTAAITAYMKGHVMRTRLGVTKADGEVTLLLHKVVAAPATVKVSGTLKNGDSTATNTIVGPSTYGVAHTSTSSSYVSSAEKGKAFDLYAYQGKWTNTGDRTYSFLWKGAAKVPHTGSSSDIAQEIDFTANKVTATKVTGTMQLPTGKGMVAIGSQPHWYVRQRHNGAELGRSTKTTVGSNGAFTFEGQYITPKDSTGVQTHYYAFVGTGNIGAYQVVPGFPKEGATVSGFTEMMTVTSPATGKTLAAGQAVAFTNPEAKAEPRFGIFNSAATGYCWSLHAAPGTTSVKLPALPTGVTFKDLCGTDGETTVRPALVAKREADTDYEVNYSYSDTFKIRLAHPKTISFTGGFFDMDTDAKVGGIKLCIKDDSTVPCVTSATTTTPNFSLASVPNDRDVEITAAKTGHYTVVLPRQKQSSITSTSHAFLSTAAGTKLAGKVGLTLDKLKGLLVVSVGGVNAKGATATLTSGSGSGPYYADTTGYPDKTLKAVDKQGWIWFANVTAGAFEVAVKDKAGKACSVVLGPAGSPAGSVKAKAYAESLTSVWIDCL